MDIRRGKESITFKPAPPVAPPKLQSHSLYMAWDCFLDMIHSRGEAVAFWRRLTHLRQQVEKRPDHSDVERALQRIDAFASQVRDHQLRFLRTENIAEGYWASIPAKERRKEAIDDMFGVEPDASSILGAWHRQLGESGGAPIECKMDATVLQFAPLSVAKCYRRAIGS
jgi:hypothetical protein